MPALRLAAAAAIAVVAAAGPPPSPGASSGASSLSAVWRSDTRTAVADAFVESVHNGDEIPTCDLAVVGAGWAGAYFAWRLAIDAGEVDAARVCVFEANGRVGGRIFSVRDLPSLDGLSLDVGGYRFIEIDALPADLVWNGLKVSERAATADPPSSIHCAVAPQAL